MDHSVSKNGDLRLKMQVNCPWTSSAPLSTPLGSKTQSHLNKSEGSTVENNIASTSGIINEKEIISDKKVLS